MELTNVQGNLITRVDYTVWEDPPSVEAMGERDAAALKQLVAAADAGRRGTGRR